MHTHTYRRTDEREKETHVLVMIEKMKEKQTQRMGYNFLFYTQIHEMWTPNGKNNDNEIKRKISVPYWKKVKWREAFINLQKWPFWPTIDGVVYEMVSGIFCSHFSVAAPLAIDCCVTRRKRNLYSRLPHQIGYTSNTFCPIVKLDFVSTLISTLWWCNRTRAPFHSVSM